MSYHFEESYIEVIRPVGTLTLAGTTPATAADWMTINIPRAGRWRITAHVRGNNLGANGGAAFVITTAANAVIANTETMVVFAGSAVVIQGSASRTIVVTTTGATSYKTRVYCPVNANLGSVGSDPNGRSYMIAERIG